MALHETYDIYGFYETAKNLTKNPEVPNRNKFTVDLRNSQLVEQLVKQIEPDFVFHLAARSEVANSFNNYLEVTDINYKGTVALAEANRIYNPNLQLFVMASTMETYGHGHLEVPFVEDTIQRPAAPYAVAKVASEKYLHYMDYAYGFPYVILRQTNTYGRHDNNFFVMERIISQFFTDFDYIYLGNPEPKRNFLYISDLVDLYRVLLKKVDVARGQTFVTGPDNALKIRDLAHLIAVMMGYQPEDAPDLFIWDTIPERPGEIYYLNSNPKKAKVHLDWEPQVSLKEGIYLTIKMFEEGVAQ